MPRGDPALILIRYYKRPARTWNLKEPRINSSQNPLDVLIAEPPSISRAQAVDVAREHYDLDVTATVLTGERDQNFHLTTDSGKQFVLKIANSAEEAVVTDFQIQALLHIQQKADALIITPTVLKTTNNEHSIVLELEGRPHIVRIVSYLDGTPFEANVPDAKLARNMGRYLARLGRALIDFSHPGADHSLLWDIKQALHLRGILQHIPDDGFRGLAASALDTFEANILPVFGELRWQVIHNDLNPGNILLSDSARPDIAGVIDFGDMLRSPLIVDVAVAASYLRVFEGNPLTLIAEFVAGYHQETPLNRAEIDILHDLIKLRLIATIAILHWRASLRGKEDKYLQESVASESTAEAFLHSLMEIPRENAAQAYRQVCASVSASH